MKSKKRIFFLMMLFICISLFLGLSYQLNRSTSFKERKFKSYYGGDMIINKLTKNGGSYGHTVWLKGGSHRIKAKYFASGNVYSKYNYWRTNYGKRIMLACSGAFATGNVGNYKPLGITVDNRKILNRELHKEMDALVVVDESGGIEVFDIENRILVLNGDTLNIADYPDRNKLLNWAVRKNATIFQTQLLAYNNELRLSVKEARIRLRERRILVLGKDSLGKKYQIIFNIVKSVYLGDVAYDILNYLRNINFEVFAMLNLDTGVYNIIRIYDQGGRELQDIKTRLDITGAINLLVYYYE